MPWEAGDLQSARACYLVARAVGLADDPLGPPMSERVSRVLLKSPTEPAQTWLVPGDTPGSAQGFYHLRLPDRENRHRARLDLQVHPEYRRRGIGSALLRHAAGRAAENGRSVLSSGAILGSPGEAFALRFGATPGLADARRVQVLAKLPAGQVAALRSAAE